MKRSRKKIETVESKLLKILRNQKRVSQRELAKRMNITQTKVGHVESGRENVTDEYVAIFLPAVGSNFTEWKKLKLGDTIGIDEHREICKTLVDGLPSSKLKIIYDILLSYKSMVVVIIFLYLTRK